jgi:murein DD-endopeptidase MepM/ murein hydrolase activator NlpD
MKRSSGFRLVLALAISCAAGVAGAEAPRSEGWHAPSQPGDEISPGERERIWQELDRVRSGLALPKAGAQPRFRWPLRSARGYYGPVFSRVSFHVDHDAAFPGVLRDFNCGTRTYDRDTGYNHQGTDISIVPDPWNLMDSGRIEIVAAAEGTILTRTDGNFDRNCTFGGTQWNAVYVQHDDGSIAWYGHMRNGSTTPKSVGERVAAGEYLGLVGSSGNSTGPHLHLEVYDAERRLIDPFAGTCNARNAESWWESQPAYQSTAVMALTTATAAPTFATCGTDGRVQDTGSFNPRSAFASGDTVWLVANLRDVPVGTRVTYTLRDPSGAAWSQFDGSPASQAFNSVVAWTNVGLPVTAPAGNWMAEARIAESNVQVPFTVSVDGAVVPDYSDLWWNESESGWGVNLNHQGEKLFATWFTYDTDGSGMWLVMPEGSAQPGGGFAGPLYRTTGVPFAQINGAPASNPSPALVGSARFTFTGGGQGLFSYTVDGISQQKTLQRQRFSAPATCMQTRAARTHATNYRDLWWNPAESGWGINLAHQGDTIFATWFTYGAGGRGMWLVAPDVRRQALGEFRGRLYRTTGVAFDRIAGAPAMVGNPADVGEITLTFTDGEHGRLAYSLDGVAQSRAIERQVFAASTPLCR